MGQVWLEIQNTGNTRNSLGATGNILGTRLGTLGTSSSQHNLPIPPFEPVPLTLPVPQPALRPQTTRGTNLVRLCPLRLRLVDAFLQDLRNCCALFALQPRSNHLFPWIAFVARLLLIAGQLHQIWRVEPPDAARFESGFGFRPQLVAVTGREPPRRSAHRPPARNGALRSRRAGRCRG